MKLDDVLAGITGLGVTGSRDVTSISQLNALRAIIELRHVDSVHHGDCVGVDATAHAFAVNARKIVVVHPPSDPKHRAWCGVRDQYRATVIVRPTAGYLERDHAIVDMTNVLVAVPVLGVVHRVCRGDGTCATVRYALRRKRPVVVIRPDGELALLTTRDLL